MLWNELHEAYKNVTLKFSLNRGAFGMDIYDIGIDAWSINMCKYV